MIFSTTEPITALVPLITPVDHFVSKGESRDALITGLAWRNIAWEPDLGNRFGGPPEERFPFVPSAGRLYRPVLLPPEDCILGPGMNSTKHLCRVGGHSGGQRTPLEFVLHFVARCPLHTLEEWGYRRIVFLADLGMPPGNPDCLELIMRDDARWHLRGAYDYPDHEWEQLDGTLFILCAIDTD